MSAPSIQAPQRVAGTVDEAPAKRPVSPFERFGLSGRTLDAVNWLSVALAIYVLITAVNVIGTGFGIATGDQAESLFAFATNPIIG
ncbi:hypothetical protein [Nesterenkonia sp. AN1]|nr:hypothetical protein [Nesterenkonia sp. AN1]